MTLLFSRKTWYLLLTISTAVSMLSVFNGIIGQDTSGLDFIAFAIMGLVVLFLAAEQDNDAPTRKRYFYSFLLGMGGYAFSSISAIVALAGLSLTWPMLIYTELKRGAPVAERLRLLILAEGCYAVFWFLAMAGNQNVVLFTAVFAALKAFARGWAAYTLVRWHKQSNEE